MRAIRARYDPYEQSRGRVEQLRGLGHSVDKVEFICMGGTFLSLPDSYRSNFMAQLHNSLSGYTGTDLDEAVKCVTIPYILWRSPLMPWLFTDIRRLQRPSVLV